MYNTIASYSGYSYSITIANGVVNHKKLKKLKLINIFSKSSPSYKKIIAPDNSLGRRDDGIDGITPRSA